VKRYLSLYYGSLGAWRALQALWCWVKGVVVPAQVLRDSLSAAVRAHLGDTQIFAYGSGRSALAACLRAAGVGSGDEVLLASYTCLAVPTAVVAVGAVPVYLDIDPETLNVDAESVESALGPNVRAVVVQHTLGKVAPVDAIVAAGRQRGVLVVEDCALAVGSKRDGRSVGTVADAGFFSMELSKTVSCGWGGLLLVNDPALAAAVEASYAEVPERSRWSASRDLFQTVLSAWCHLPGVYSWCGRYVLHVAFQSGLFRRSTPAREFEGSVGPRFVERMSGPQAALAALQ
jgi:perosamine synthetase